MVTDDELIAKIRAELDRELALVHPPEGVVGRAWDSARKRSRSRTPIHLRSLRQRGRSFVGAGVMVLSVLIVAVVAGGAVLLIRHHQPTSSQTLAAPRDPTSETAMLKILGVLRRPQTPTDHPPSLLKEFDTGIPIGSPIPGLERRATVTSSGAAIYLVPIDRPTPEQIRRFVSTLTPERLRPTSRRNMLSRVRSEPKFRGVAVVGGGSTSCTTTTIEAGNCWQSSGGLGQNSVTVVVPDRVASVSITVHSNQTHQANTITTAVHGNVAWFQTSTPIENLAAETKMVWRTTSGDIIRRPPSSGG
jgi:hypothetical protein